MDQYYIPEIHTGRMDGLASMQTFYLLLTRVKGNYMITHFICDRTSTVASPRDWQVHFKIWESNSLVENIQVLISQLLLILYFLIVKEQNAEWESAMAQYQLS